MSLASVATRCAVLPVSHSSLAWLASPVVCCLGLGFGISLGVATSERQARRAAADARRWRRAADIEAGPYAAIACVSSCVHPPPPVSSRIPPSESPLFAYSPRDLDLAVPLPKLRYPIVLVHGYLGFDSLIRTPDGRPLLEYFGSVRQHLTDHGLTVITPVNPPAASIAARAKKLQVALGIKKRGGHQRRGSEGQAYAEREDVAGNQPLHEDSDVPLAERVGKIEFINTGGREYELHQEPSKRVSAEAKSRDATVSSQTGSVKTAHEKSEEQAAERADDGPSIVMGGNKISLSKYTGKFHLVAHSMGGLDSRYLISHLQEPAADAPDHNRVLSLTTVSSPHRGSPIADMLLDVLDLPFTFNPKRLASAPTLNKFSQWLASWFGIDVTGINNLSTAAMDDFNSRIQNHPNVKYMSYGGAKDFPWYSIWHLPSSWIRDYYDTHDQSIDADGICAGGANDGLVAINSANWGEYQGTTNLDHLEQIGLGVWNKHLPLYRQIVFRLHELEQAESAAEKEAGDQKVDDAKRESATKEGARADLTKASTEGN